MGLKSGIAPFHFAIIVVITLMIGLTPPPVGVCLFVAANIARISLTEISKAVWPFIVCNVIVLMLVSYIPELALWLPSVFYK